MEGSASGSEKGRGSTVKLLAIVIVAIIVIAGIAIVFMQPEEKEKNIVVADISGNPESLDPVVDYETVGGELIQNVYETLMFYDGGSASVLKPMLCEEVPTVANGLITNDGYTYTYNIKSGIMFHDGNEMTAEDVYYSFERGLRLNDPHGPVWMVGELLIPDYYDYDAGSFDSNGNLVGGVPVSVIRQHIWEQEDKITFNLTVAFPGWNYVITFGVGSVVSKAYVEANGGQTQDGYTFMSNHMCGTGAFMLTDYTPSSHTLMTRFDDYWQGKAKINTVLIQQVPDDNTKILMIKTGEADFATIPRALRAGFEGSEGIEIGEGNGTFNIDFIGMNQKINMTGLDTSKTNVPSTFMADKNIRLAFAHAFDYNKFLLTQFNGSGIQPNGAIPKGMFGYDATVPVYDFNVEKVKSFLENATVTIDGVETNYLDAGFKLEVFYNAGNTVRQTACELFKDGLEAASDKITITVTGVEWAVYLNLRKGGQMPVMFLGWAPDYADPNNYLQPFYHSSGTYARMCGYFNATLDQKIEEAAAEQNTVTRAGLYSDLMFDMYEECIFVWTVQATNFNVHRDWISGYEFNAMYSGLYYYPMDKDA